MTRKPHHGPAHEDDPAFPRWGNHLYVALGPYAHWVKTALQMATGVIVVGLLAAKAVALTGHTFGSPLLFKLVNEPALDIVGRALTFSAGFELAYMLFTPGPDEAIEPVILGLASAVLIVISDERVDWADAVVAPLLCVAMALLFYIDRKYVRPKS